MIAAHVTACLRADPAIRILVLWQVLDRMEWKRRGLIPPVRRAR